MLLLWLLARSRRHIAFTLELKIWISVFVEMADDVQIGRGGGGTPSGPAAFPFLRCVIALFISALLGLLVLISRELQLLVCLVVLMELGGWEAPGSNLCISLAVLLCQLRHDLLCS